MTAQDILAFASSHGVLVHPRINQGFGSLDAFVSEYNGMCPSVPDRQCPCQESLESIAARDPMDQHCDGYLLATAAYMNAVDPKGKLYGEVDDQPPVPVSDEVSEVVKGYLVGIDEAIKLFNSEKHEESFDTLVELADGTDCNVCKEQFMTEAIHVNNARNLCELPYVGGCNDEKARVKVRLDKMRSFFAGAVDSSDSPKKSAPSPYRAAMADWMKSADLEPYPQKVRFFMASQLAGGKCSTVEEAKDAAMAAHAEWFA